MSLTEQQAVAFVEELEDTGVVVTVKTLPSFHHVIEVVIVISFCLQVFVAAFVALHWQAFAVFLQQL